MNEAQQAGDFETYFKERSIVEAVERDGWDDADYTQQLNTTNEKPTIPNLASLMGNGLDVEENGYDEGPFGQPVSSKDGVDPLNPPDSILSSPMGEGNDNAEAILFHRRREGVWADFPYATRIQANREITDAEIKQMASLLGYSYRVNVRGESLGWPVRDTPSSFYVFSDTTKSQRDDLGDAMDDLENSYPQLLKEGTPQRKRQNNTRAIEGMGDDNLKIDFYYDSVSN